MPQWQVLNGGIWNVLEESIRVLAQKLDRKLTVQTGTYEIAKINNDALYLSTDRGPKIPVPLYVWKLIFDPDQDKAMVFVNVNQLFNTEQVGSLCPQDGPNLCSENGWIFKDSLKGVLYCCTYRSFKQKIPWILSLNGNIQPLKNIA